MRQLRIAKVSRTRRRRYDDAPLPLDPRDPDVVRAKQVPRDGEARTNAPPSPRSVP
jgi:hypothetical protein